MPLKNYSIRLDEEEYEKLKKSLSGFGDPDINIGFVLRQYIRDLNKAIPDLKKSDLGLSFNLAFFGSMLRQFARSAQLEALVKGDKIMIDKIKKTSKDDEEKKMK
jgi:hypothetical protein